MKTQQVKFILLSAALLAGSASFASAQDQPGSSHQLTPSEVKGLLKGASTVDRDRTLAAYFKLEAQQELDAALLHEEMARMYDSPMPAGMKHSVAVDSKSHCLYFAKNARKAAKQDLNIAADFDERANWLSVPHPKGGMHRP